MHSSVPARLSALAPLLAATLLVVGCSSDGRTPTQPGTGALTVTVNGLPSGASAAVTVSGPSGFSSTVAHTSTLANLAPGSYLLAAAAISSHDTSYQPSPPSATVTVAASAEPSATTIAYAKTVSTLDLSISAMYLTQSTQTMSGAVPLVANRDGYLRVFVVANQSNSAAPQVRVRLYVNGTQEGSAFTIAAPSHFVPQSINEGALASTWNVAIPGSLIKPGLSILADIDPSHAFAESNRANNSFPVSGTPLSLTVKTLSPFYIRFIPVKQSINGLIGNVSTSNKDALLAKTVKIHPISTFSADVHAMYTTDTPALTGGNGNGAWGTILGEIQTLRAAEGSPRNYFGIVKTAYTSGIAGISYIGANASVGYDGGSEVEIISHELGHSWGRSHAPCGINGNTDPNFPYPAGNIGVYGLDVATATLYPPSSAEVMSYCHPQWISDYTYTGVYGWRVGHPSAPDFVHADFQPCVIVWGQIVDGRVVLEPSFQVLTYPSLPAHSGAYALRALDANGAQLFALSFDGDSVTDAPGAGRSFAYAIPLSRAAKPIASLVLNGPRGSARRDAQSLTSSANASARALNDAHVATTRRVAGGAAISWNAARYPLLVVRDAKTGEILSLARSGHATIATSASDLELTLSDGVASTVLQSHVAQ